MMRRDTVDRLIDALVLLVRLHLVGFFWGDCSLSNTLFRRDAGAFAAYLVDAETGELQPKLSSGQRSHDLANAEINIAGELMDLQAGRLLDDSVDAIATAEKVVERYDSLWTELTSWEAFDVNDRWRIARRRAPQRLGFDVAELDIVTDIGGRTVRLQPKVVDPGHHSRRLLRLTGIDAQENQARRMLNDLDAYSADRPAGRGRGNRRLPLGDRRLRARAAGGPERAARQADGSGDLSRVLEHRWYLSEQSGVEVGTMDAARSYVENVLRHKPDEEAVLEEPPTVASTGSIPVVTD